MGKVEITDEQILEFMADDKTARQIARITGAASDTTIYKRIREMEPAKVAKAKEDGRRVRAQREKMAKEKEEIADETSSTKVRKSAKEIAQEKEKKFDELVKQGKKAEEISQMTNMQIKTVKAKMEKKRVNGTIIRQKLREKTITQGDIKEYRNIIDEKYDQVKYDEVVLLANVYIKTGQAAEALRFLNLFINNQDFQYLGIDKMKKLKGQVEEIQNRQRVRRMLKADPNIKAADIAAKTGLKETEVLAIKRKMEEASVKKDGREMGE